MKLAFLADVEHYRLYGQPLSDATWIYYAYGPFTTEVYAATNELVAEGLVTCQTVPGYDNPSRIYGLIPVEDAGIFDSYSIRAARALNQVLGEYESLTLVDVKAVAYGTATMKNAKPGDTLDFSHEPRTRASFRNRVRELINRAPDPDRRAWGDPAESAREDMEILDALEGYRKEANQVSA